MPLERAGFHRFRNLADGEIDTSADQVFFIGLNGQGKTNLLEALYVLMVGSSFRTRRDTVLAQGGSGDWSVRGLLSGNTTSLSLQVKFNEGKKSFFLDGNPLNDRKDLLFQQSVVLYSHEDYLIISGSSEERRRFFDQTAIMASGDYLRSWKRYHAFMKQRNEALRQGLADDFLDVYEDQMDMESVVICEERNRLTNILSQEVGVLFETVSHNTKKLEIVYNADQKNWNRGDLSRILQENRLNEREVGYSRRGPHRDRWKLAWSGEDFQDRASTGQIRLASLCFKSVQARFLAAETGKIPIFLLDDVLLELDNDRRERFSNTLPPCRQAFYTFIPDQNEERFITGPHIIYTLEEGKWTQQTKSES